jgi:hypothetical protein
MKKPDHAGDGPKAFSRDNMETVSQEQRTGKGALADFSERKHLPLKFLVKYGLSDASNGRIRIDYGSGARARFRRSAATAHPTHWDKDDALPKRVYANGISNSGGTTLHIVEGESCALTCWFHGLSAIGVPGSTLAQTIQPEDFAGYSRVLIVREPDAGGDGFVPRVASRLRGFDFPGEIIDVSLDPYKDVSELHIAKADQNGGHDAFVAFIEDAAAKGKPVELMRTVTPNGKAVTDEPVTWEEVRPWPTLDPAALYGLAGAIVKAVAEETEADPAALLVTLLVGFGNAVGPSAHARVHDDRHPARLYAAIVGSTSTGGKGTSLATIKPFLRAGDAEWFDECRKAGFGSGEAIISELSGAHRSKDDEGPIEHRAFVIEPEFARLLTVNGRDGSTSSPILRSAWDDGRLELRHSKSRMIATGAHLSLLSHISPEELMAKLSSTEVASGFANRMLFVLSRRARKLPSGGNIPSTLIGGFGRRLNEAMRFARGIGIMQRSTEAEAVWAELYYAEPDREGVVGAVCDRWQAQKLRLSVVYALLDRSETITPEHVIAAEAFWRYCVGSAERIWGEACGDGVADGLLAELRAVYPDGLTGAEQSHLFGRHVREGRLRTARDGLLTRHLIRVERTSSTGGRPATVAYAVPREKSEKSEKSTMAGDGAGLNSLISLNSQRKNNYESPVIDHGVTPSEKSEISPHQFQIEEGSVGTHCSRCGVPWSSHGAPPRSQWIVIAPKADADALFEYAEYAGVTDPSEPIRNSSVFTDRKMEQKQ